MRVVMLRWPDFSRWTESDFNSFLRNKGFSPSILRCVRRKRWFQECWVAGGLRHELGSLNKIDAMCSLLLKDLPLQKERSMRKEVNALAQELHKLYSLALETSERT